MNNRKVPPVDSEGPSTSKGASEHVQPDTNDFPYCYPIWDPKTNLYGYVTVDGILPPNPVFPGVPFAKFPVLSKEGVNALCSSSEDSNRATSSKTTLEKEDEVICFGDNLQAIRELYNSMAVNCNTTYQLYATLEEIYNGCTKQVKVKRVVPDNNGRAQIAVKTLPVVIKPGCETGNRIAFVRQGNQLPGRTAASVIFEIKEKPHTLFTREGINLRYTHKLSLKKALCGGVICVPLLSGTKRQVVINQVTSLGTVKRLPHDGMPNPREPNSYGDLFVNLDIVFPTSLTREQKDVAALLTAPQPRVILNRRVHPQYNIRDAFANDLPAQKANFNLPSKKPTCYVSCERNASPTKHPLKRRAQSTDIIEDVSARSVTAQKANVNLPPKKPTSDVSCERSASPIKPPLKIRAQSTDIIEDVSARSIPALTANVNLEPQEPTDDASYERNASPTKPPLKRRAQSTDIIEDVSARSVTAQKANVNLTPKKPTSDVSCERSASPIKPLLKIRAQSTDIIEDVSARSVPARTARVNLEPQEPTDNASYERSASPPKRTFKRRAPSADISEDAPLATVNLRPREPRDFARCEFSASPPKLTARRRVLSPHTTENTSVRSVPTRLSTVNLRPRKPRDDSRSELSASPPKLTARRRALSPHIIEDVSARSFPARLATVNLRPRKPRDYARCEFSASPPKLTARRRVLSPHIIEDVSTRLDSVNFPPPKISHDASRILVDSSPNIAIKGRDPSSNVIKDVSTDSVSTESVFVNCPPEEQNEGPKCIFAVSSPQRYLKRRALSADITEDTERNTVNGCSPKSSDGLNCVATVSHKRDIVSEEAGPSKISITTSPKIDLTKLNMSMSARFNMGFDRPSVPKLVSRGTGNLNSAREYLLKTLQDSSVVSYARCRNVIDSPSSSSSEAEQSNSSREDVEMSFMGWLGFMETSTCHIEANRSMEKPLAASFAMVNAKKTEESHRVKQLEACVLARIRKLSSFQTELLRFLDEPFVAPEFPQPRDGCVTALSRTICFSNWRSPHIQELRRQLFPVLPFGIKISPKGLIVEFASPFLARRVLTLMQKYFFQVQGEPARASLYGVGIYWCPVESVHFIPFRGMKTSEIYTAAGKGMVDLSTLPLSILKDVSLADLP